ncbi:hypothetical protein SAMN05660841_03070 [Sphingobacterium nematocida]|uniref:Uncharacterized protein n=1 Tax=Sphingobacterium nematocida TaxID=1513896 RepID=A0A1T5F6B0_9SPHI|nr:hypothetical protein [Sphingobacterium nematocida]SKB91650.1 hypothetical protein SAMN05660841_03070 [Sphingobacterium nematocida]
MRRKIYIIIGILILVILSIAGYVVVDQLSHWGSPTGGRGPNYPYFITNEPTIVKKIVVPKGTKLTYEEHFFKAGQQIKIMNEKKLTGIELPEGKTIDWGGVPVFMIIKFYNPGMQGYSLYPDFNQLNNNKKTKFSKLWEGAGCIDALGITVKNTDDWSFNINNITKVSDCGVNSLYYIDDEKRKKQEQLPDELYKELKKVNLQ